MKKIITNVIATAVLIGVGCIAGHHLTCTPKNDTPHDTNVVVDLPSWQKDKANEIQNYLDTITDSISLNQELDSFLSRVESAGGMQEGDYKTLDDLKMRAFDKLPEDSIAEIAYRFMLTDVKDSIRFRGHRYVDMFYKPMLELFRELQKYGFKVFVVSGADRTGLWGCIKALKNIPNTASSWTG